MAYSIFTKAFASLRRDPDLWLFSCFLCSLPLPTRKILWFVPLRGDFNEYTSVSLYLSDVLFLCLVWAWIILLYNNIIKKSIYERLTFLLRSRYRKCFAIIVFFPLLIVCWALLGMLWASAPALTGIFSIRLLGLYVLYLFIVFRVVPRGTIGCQQSGFCTDAVDSCAYVPQEAARSFSLAGRSVDNTRALPLVFLGSFNDRRVVSRELSKGCFTWNIYHGCILPIVVIGLIESIMGIAQFFVKHSLQLGSLLESELNLDTPGVAKIVIDHEKYLRAYGTFPHPNVLGGFLVFSLFATHYAFYLFHGEQKKWLWRSVLFIQYGALVLTFSKSAWLGLIGAYAVFFLQKGVFHVKHKHMYGYHNDVKSRCSTWNEFIPQKIHVLASWVGQGILQKKNIMWFLTGSQADKGVIVSRGSLEASSKSSTQKSFFQRVKNSARKYTWDINMFHVQHTIRVSLIFLILSFSLFWFYRHMNISGWFHQSVSERMVYQREALSIIHNSPIMGISGGQLVYFMEHWPSYPLMSWQLQPVHNVFLLVWAELGIVGFLFFGVFIVVHCGLIWDRIVPRGTAHKDGFSFTGNSNGQVRKNCLVTQKSQVVIESSLPEVRTGRQGCSCGTLQSELMIEGLNVSHETVRKDIFSRKKGEESSNGCMKNFLSKPDHSQVVPRETIWSQKISREECFGLWNMTQLSLIALGIISLFDHYLWDLQPGRLLLWMVLGLHAGLFVEQLCRREGCCSASSACLDDQRFSCRMEERVH